MVDFSIGTHIGMSAIGMLNIPMEIFFSSTRTRIGIPLVPVRVHIPAVLAAPRIGQPIAAFRRDEWMAPTAKEQSPGILFRPINPLTHRKVLDAAGIPQMPMESWSGSRATKRLAQGDLLRRAGQAGHVPEASR